MVGKMKQVEFHFTQEMIFYTWRQLAKRAGVDFPKHSVTGLDSLDVPVFYGSPDQARLETPGVIVCCCAETAWSDILNAPPNSIHWRHAGETIPTGANLPFDNSIPVLFWGREVDGRNQPFAARHANGSLVFYADILASSFYMLSRWEEMVLSARDEHGRFPASASTAYRQGFLHLPVVDQYALILRSWLELLLPDWKPKKNVFSIKLSHDIDHVRCFNSLGEVLIKCAGDLINRHSLQKAWQTIRVGISERIRPTHSPEYRGIVELAEISRHNGLVSAFYFKSSSRGERDSGYSLEMSWLKALVGQLRSQGFEIGFHAGYYTFNDIMLFCKEKDRFVKALGIKEFGGRQHYLRFRVPYTWRNWEQARLTYDSSMNYADANGFRCGTCHPFQPFDLEQNRMFGIWEYPLVVMEGTLKMGKLSLAEAHDEIIILASRCLEVEGMFTLLWHNTSLYGEWSPWRELYKTIIPELVSMNKGQSIVDA